MRDRAYVPGRIRIDMRPDHLVAGATYTERYTQIDKNGVENGVASEKLVQWTVEAVDDPRTVPAAPTRPPSRRLFQNAV